MRSPPRHACLLLCAALFAVCPSLQAAEPASGAAGAVAVLPQDLPALTEYRSENGQLRVTLRASEQAVLVDGVSLQAQVFNSDYAGPLLRLRPGDHLQIHLINQLAEVINLHFHGSHASPLGHGDNMHVEVAPGSSYDYALDIPVNQPPGLYWYHTHVHGHSETQISRGLSGSMIIEGIEQQVGGVAQALERVLALKMAPAPAGDSPALQRLHGVLQSINGQAFTHLRATGGTQEFWRISNQSANDYYHLSMPGLHFRVVAMDGVMTQQDVVQDTLDIAPAGRVEVLIDLPAAGHFSLRSGATLTGTGKQRTAWRELAQLDVAAPQPAATASTGLESDASARAFGSGAPLPGALAADAADAAAQASDVDNASRASAAAARSRRPALAGDLRRVRVTAERSFHFTQKPGEEVYLINDQTFDHTRIDTRVPLGSIEEWTIFNDTEDMHVFHIHQVHFQVLAINGEAQDYNELRDTVRIPEMGSVTLRIAFTEPQIVGRFMYHCHVLKHEDRGMMANIEVYDPNDQDPNAQDPADPGRTQAPAKAP